MAHVCLCWQDFCAPCTTLVAQIQLNMVNMLLHTPFAKVNVYIYCGECYQFSVCLQICENNVVCGCVCVCACACDTIEIRKKATTKSTNAIECLIA